jgi:hypothetical protein
MSPVELVQIPWLELDVQHVGLNVKLATQYPGDYDAGTIRAVHRNTGTVALILSDGNTYEMKPGKESLARTILLLPQ